ncbi:hypothetical protein HU200_060530 [Digitaria exilis]|uniref:Pectinesterase catalytic domain-containing protein n=1 Tax=Digitaria exilis TaxID=1010633 RepID=A0A835AAL9_9POAL|nr:hypothetical protein HU200_060530 [Digitaria exilis]
MPAGDAFFACCLLLLLGSASGNGGSSVSTTTPLPAGGGSLPLWVQQLAVASGVPAPTLGALDGKHLVVSPNARGGDGQFSSINAALAAAAAEDLSGRNRFIIFIDEGVYDETLNITMEKVILVGQGIGKSVITGNKSVAFDNLTTQETATLSNREASCGLHVEVAQLPYLPLFYPRLSGYTGCGYWLPNVCGDRYPWVRGLCVWIRAGCGAGHNVVTAQGRSNPEDKSGFVFQNCSLTADQGANLTGVETFLGRPWKNHSHVVFMESFLDAIVDPLGWIEWNRTHGEIPSTVRYLEYGNSGPGADTTGRVKNPAVRVATCSEAAEYTADRFVDAKDWMVPATEPKVTIPYPRGLQHPCPAP